MALDPVGMFQVVATQNTAAGDPHPGVVVDGLVLHPAVQYDACCVAKNLVGLGCPYKSETFAIACHRSKHPDVVAENPVAAHRGGRFVNQAGGGAVDIVSLDASAEIGCDPKAYIGRRNIISTQAPVRLGQKTDPHQVPLDRIVAHLEVVRPLRVQGTFRPGKCPRPSGTDRSPARLHLR